MLLGVVLDKPVIELNDVPVTVPTVVMLAEPAHVDKAVFSTLLKPTSVLVTVSQAGAAPAALVPVIRRNWRVVVVLGASVVRVSAADAYSNVNAATVLNPVPPRVTPNVPAEIADAFIDIAVLAAAVKRPCASTVNVATCVADPYAAAVTVVLGRACT
jgi:hypothetical protein